MEVKMKDLWTVASYTMKEMLKKKTFIISNIIIIFIIVIGFNVPNIISSIKTEDTTTEDTVLVVDSDNIFEGTLENLNHMELGETFEVTNEKLDFDTIKQKIENGDIENAWVINREGQQIHIEYIVENAAVSGSMPEAYMNALSSIYTNLQLSKLDLTPTELSSLSPNFTFDLTQTEEQEVKGNVVAIMLLSLVLFYAIYFCAYQVSTSITTEKTSKIMETLVTSTTPRTIVLGKTIGIGIVGLLQVVILVAVALICAKTCLPAGTLESIIDLSQITPFLGAMTVIYFLLGYFVYAMLYALTGSTVSKPEEVQSANGPVAMIAVIGFYLAYFTMMNPTSDLNVFASIFPFSSPFCMPFRIMMGVASVTDVVISLAILVVTILIVANVAIKIYSNAILNYGTKMSLGDMIRIYKDKNN